MINITIPELLEPQLIDKAFEEIRSVLTASLPWLNYAFGKAETRPIYEDGRKEIAPFVYTGGLDYKKLFPDSHLGNFSFFTIKDGHDLDVERQAIEGDAEFSLIVWFDFRKVFPDDHERRNVRHVINLVLTVFRTSAFGYSSVKMNQVFEDGANIYKGYSDKEIDNQFLMRPYGGFRLSGKIKYNEQSFLNCVESVVPSGIGFMIVETNNQVV